MVAQESVVKSAYEAFTKSQGLLKSMHEHRANQIGLHATQMNTDALHKLTKKNETKQLKAKKKRERQENKLPTRSTKSKRTNAAAIVWTSSKCPFVSYFLPMGQHAQNNNTPTGDWEAVRKEIAVHGVSNTQDTKKERAITLNNCIQSFTCLKTAYDSRLEASLTTKANTKKGKIQAATAVNRSIRKCIMQKYRNAPKALADPSMMPTKGTSPFLTEKDISDLATEVLDNRSNAYVKKFYRSKTHTHDSTVGLESEIEKRAKLNHASRGWEQQAYTQMSKETLRRYVSKICDRAGVDRNGVVAETWEQERFEACVDMRMWFQHLISVLVVLFGSNPFGVAIDDTEAGYAPAQEGIQNPFGNNQDDLVESDDEDDGDDDEDKAYKAQSYSEKENQANNDEYEA